MSFCRNCGNKVATSEKYCSKCGTSCSLNEDSFFSKSKNKITSNVLILKIGLVIGIMLALMCKYFPTTSRWIYQSSFHTNSDASSFSILLIISYAIMVGSTYMLLKTSELNPAISMKKLIITVLSFVFVGVIIGHIAGIVWVNLFDEKMVGALKNSASATGSIKSAMMASAMEMRIDALKELWRFIGMTIGLLISLFICRDTTKYNRLSILLKNKF